MATITGTGGNDTLAGTSSNDTILGSTGSDVIDGGAGFDSIEYKNAANGLIVDFAAGTVSGGAAGSMTFTGIERFVSGGFNDQLSGNGASQILTGQGGNDTLWGAGGADTLWGGTGSDTFIFRETGTANADRVSDWQSGLDTILLDGAVMSALGASGDFAAGDTRFWSSGTGAAHDADDRVLYNTSNGQLWYDADGNGSGAAVLIATLQSGATLVATDIAVENGSSGGGGGGGGGGGTVNGTAGNDSLVGGPGNDTINGLAGNDTLVGLAGDDVLDGGAGADSMDGGLGNDTFFFNPGDVLADAGGVDTLVVENTGTLPEGIENLTVRNAFQETEAFGNSQGNVIRVESAAAGSVVYVDGRGGNDTVDGSGGFVVALFNGNFGNDSVQGGARGGWLDFSGLAGAVVVQIASGTATSSAGSVTFIGIANVVGSQAADRITAGNSGSLVNGFRGDDTLVGGSGNDTFFGEGTPFGTPTETFGTGNDSLSGGAGNDTLFGNDGNDTIDGGLGNDRIGSGFVEASEGNDTFMFTVAPGAANADAVVDFNSATDRIVLDGSAHADTGPSGTFAAGDARFWSSSTGTAHDGDDRVIYNTSSGELWYDADGNGAGSRQLIATLEGTPGLAASDITIVNGSIGGGGGGGGGSAINGTAGNDTLSGTAGNDTINGLGGNDTILGTTGNDAIDGGTGFDSIEYKNASTGLVVDFAAGTISSASGTMTFTGIERIVAGGFNDQLTGSAASQTLTGQSGSDTIAGAGGTDTLWGGGGSDF
ncbi:MAG TPA: calcium-binding protein, partial [Burkholderiales bacterium]|nr:calcium-binding protein [Burkholderiales bacterium]